jgi:galactoside O-acetyltransferase
MPNSFSADSTDLFNDNLKRHLKYFGKGTYIGPLVKIVNPELIEIGDYSRIDDFCVLVGGKGIKIGRYIHIASFCSITGGGEFIMHDYSTISAGCRVFTSNDDFHGKSMTNPTVPSEFKKPIVGRVKIEKHVIVGANSVILPNVLIHEGAAVGACSMVNKDLAAWTINGGVPSRFIKSRPWQTICKMEQELEKNTEVNKR